MWLLQTADSVGEQVIHHLRKYRGVSTALTTDPQELLFEEEAVVNPKFVLRRHLSSCQTKARPLFLKKSWRASLSRILPSSCGGSKVAPKD